jgi:23S rRNA maturation mini-RNase III
VLVVWIHDRRSDFLGATQHRVVTAHHKKAYQAKKLMEAILQQLAEGKFEIAHRGKICSNGLNNYK